MKRALNATINRSKNEKNDEHYTQLVAARQVRGEDHGIALGQTSIDGTREMAYDAFGHGD